MEGPRTHLLRVTRADPLEGVVGERLEPHDAAAFASLHDTLFPGTYYAGAAILKRLSPHRQVFVARDGAGLCGYAYAEVASAFGEGSLEFVGVAPRGRGRGLGAGLVRAALAWTFSSGAVREVSLSVSAEDGAAGRLYRSAGFRLRGEMRTFRLVR